MLLGLRHLHLITIGQQTRVVSKAASHRGLWWLVLVLVVERLTLDSQLLRCGMNLRLRLSQHVFDTELALVLFFGGGWFGVWGGEQILVVG